MRAYNSPFGWPYFGWLDEQLLLVLAGSSGNGWKRLVRLVFGAKAHYTFKFKFLCQCNTLHEQNGTIRAYPITFLAPKT